MQTEDAAGKVQSQPWRGAGEVEKQGLQAAFSTCLASLSLNGHPADHPRGKGPHAACNGYSPRSCSACRGGRRHLVLCPSP